MRQWHSYERAPESVERRVAIWVSRVWTTRDQTILDCCTGIIGSLGLDSCVHLLRSAIEDPSIDSAVACDLRRELASWGELPLDPWRSLR
jgi:hypothetical protein